MAHGHAYPTNEPITPTTSPDTTMGLMDYLKGQFLEIIQWTDDSRDTLS